MRVLSTILASVAFLVLATQNAPGASTTISWYQCCKTTANGERFNPDGLTAAHKTLPFGTLVQFSRKGKVVTVRINDRGPFVKGRTFDLSRGAARKLGCIDRGICKVEYKILKTAK